MGFDFPKTDKEKVLANIAAIKLVKELEENQQQATAEQQTILAKYVGWGGLANVFFDRYTGKFEEQRAALEALVTFEEYHSMEQSSLTAYYTDPKIVEEMWNYLIKNGFKGGNILDPSMGTGIFFGTMPKELQENSVLVGVELDRISGLISKQLFPEATILVQGFETVDFKGHPFDLIMTNVPFSEFRISDPNFEKPYVIHDYFLKKSVNLLHENGVIGFITSMGTANKRSNSILKEIKDEVAFLGGVRLPSSAFKELAGTKVASDILFFEKDRKKTKNSSELFFADVLRSELDDEGRIFINRYFEDYNVLGEYEVRYFNGATLSVKPKNSDLIKDIKDGFSRIYGPTFAGYSLSAINILTKEKTVTNVRPYEYGYDENGNIVYHNGKEARALSKAAEITFYQVRDGNFVSWDKKHSSVAIEEFEKITLKDASVITSTYISSEPSKRGLNKGLFKGVHFYEKPLEPKEHDRIKGMIAIKEAYQSVIDIQSTSTYKVEEFKSRIDLLNKIYDDFVKKHGYINLPVNTRLFERDDRYPLIASLEEEAEDNDSSKIVYHKTKAFFEATIRPQKTITKVDSAEKALAISLSEGRGVDLDFIQSLYPVRDKELLITEIYSRIAPNIEKYYRQGIFEWVLKTDLLSGDVLTKRDLLTFLIEKGDAQADWSYYLTLIEEVIPEPITIADIEINLGSVWIPQNVLGKFAYQLLDDCYVDLDSNEAHEAIATSKISRGLTNSFIREVQYSRPNQQLGLRAEDVRTYTVGHEIFQQLLTSNQPTIEKTVMIEGKEKRVINEVATAELREIEKKIQKRFIEFVSENEDVKELIETTFNNKFNRFINKSYDGSHLHIEGLAKGYQLRPHQLNAVQRILEDKRALLAHEVGTGKTLTMVSAGFKLKELGLINKPLYVVPSSLTAQFGQEILRFYPTKKVFVTSERDFEKSRRKLFISRIASNNYDAIVIGHSQFEKIKTSTDRQEAFYKDRLHEIRSIIAQAQNDEDRITFKQATRMEKRLEQQIEDLEAGKLSKTDTFIEFEQLGIDFLFVDECHKYKNVRPITSLGNVAGIGTTTAQKNMDMEMKIRSIQEEHDGANVVFATGTPVSNSISEMYIMMNYIQPDILSEYDMDNFDAWVGAFGVIENNLEINTTGDKFIARKRFTKFTNLPELMSLFKRTTDIQMTEDLDLPVPTEERIAVKSELTEAQVEKLKELVKRTDKIKGSGIDPSQDNMLKITLEARKLALDMRLLDSTRYNLTDNNKIIQVVDRVEKIYKREKVNRGTQMIFSDIGTPTKTGFSVYDELKHLLVERGIPEEEIAFIHDANNKDAKLQLQRQMNAGEVRILLASTEKGGTGLNVQKRLKAVHHLDVPWKPSDVIQRNGRIIRQGNMYSKVQIYYYITSGSFDNYLWQIQETKLRYISQIMTSKTPVRSANDIDEQTMTASDFKAIATGNPYLKLQIELDNEFELLSKRKKAWERDVELSKKRVKKAEELLLTTKRQLFKIDKDIEQAEATKKEEVTIGDEKIIKNPFFMEFTNGYTTDVPAKAGNQLAYDMQFNQSATLKLVTLAKYRGFELKALTLKEQYRQGQFLDLKIVGQNQYNVSLDFTSPKGTIQRINNVIDSLTFTKYRLEETVRLQQITIDKGVADEVFSDQERLEFVTAKRNIVKPLVETEASVEEIERALEEFSSQYSLNEQTTNILDKYVEVSQEENEEVEILEPLKEEAIEPTTEEVPECKTSQTRNINAAIQFLSDAESFLASRSTEVIIKKEQTPQQTLVLCEQLDLFKI